MEQAERKKIQSAIDSIEVTCQELQIQVLNNIDAQMSATQGDDASKKSVETFVKKPIIAQIYRLQAERSNLMKLVHQIGPSHKNE